MRKLSVEDSIAHVTYLIENAKVTMPAGVPSWVFVFDCTGKCSHWCIQPFGPDERGEMGIKPVNILTLYCVPAAEAAAAQGYKYQTL